MTVKKLKTMIQILVESTISIINNETQLEGIETVLIEKTSIHWIQYGFV